MERKPPGGDPLPPLDDGSNGSEASGGPIKQHVDCGDGRVEEGRSGDRLDRAPTLARDVFAASGVGLAASGEKGGSDDGEQEEDALHAAIIGWSPAEGNPRKRGGHIREGIV